MRPSLALLLLLVAAALEAGGDAVVRRGLHAEAPLLWRLGLILGGGAVLTAYGVVVNLPPWDFGRLLGVYVVLFFVFAQIINRVAFGIAPSPPIYLGGALILAGGMIMTFWRT